MISTLIRNHEKRLQQTINLVASENQSSPAVRAALASDLNHRYVIPPAEKRPETIWDYPNQDLTRQIVATAETLACQLYQAAAADLRPLSGNQVAQIMLNFLSEKNRRDIWAVPADCGGHFTTRVVAADRNFAIHDIPYMTDEGIIDVDRLSRAIKNRPNPPALFLDASMVLFPHPITELRAILGERARISYDASHTLGLIAGGQFQSPLCEGADYLHGSTHKSLWGPQKGMILCRSNNEDWERLFATVLPLYVSNVHVHHIAALGIALQESKTFGQSYAQKVIHNAQTLGAALYQQGKDVLFPKKGFTQSHQIILSLDEDKNSALAAWRCLETVGIHCNAISVPFRKTFGLRIGTSEVTRRGLGTTEMEMLAKFIQATVDTPEEVPKIKEQVRELSQSFEQLHFT